MALLLTVVLSAADTVGYNILVVQLKDGTWETFQLDTRPKLLYEGTQLVVKSGLTETRYERSSVRNLNFGDEITGVKPAETGGFRFRFDGETVVVEGLRSGAHVRVAGIDGRLVETFRPSGDGTVRISLGGRSPGVYIVNIDRCRTIKVVKR